ncbi:hypothetical protein [Chromobacterium vaccinii]|uniref:hypothetical protein n=1 Tax=Chromobacterium vaccinii TaxID=1108595 RepID=UPI000E16586B|nr:hypothetical protein [Chromobacterium vaccinii]SUX30465.1 Uncharacterised protein [Chromobacterium vaccinii]
MNSFLENEFNSKKCQQILKELSDFEDARISLSTLVSRLKFLYRELQDANNEWIQNFYDAWMDLEIINALQLSNIEDGLNATLSKESTDQIKNQLQY